MNARHSSSAQKRRHKAVTPTLMKRMETMRRAYSERKVRGTESRHCPSGKSDGCPHARRPLARIRFGGAPSPPPAPSLTPRRGWRASGRRGGRRVRPRGAGGSPRPRWPAARRCPCGVVLGGKGCGTVGMVEAGMANEASVRIWGKKANWKKTVN